MKWIGYSYVNDDGKVMGYVDKGGLNPWYCARIEGKEYGSFVTIGQYVDRQGAMDAVESSFTGWARRKSG